MTNIKSGLIIIIASFVLLGSMSEMSFAKGKGSWPTPAPTTPASTILPGKTGSISGDDWQSSWLDLIPPMDFKKGDTLKIKVTGDAKKVLARLLPNASSTEASDGIVGEIRDVPSNKIINLTLEADYTNIKQISVHAGKQAFDYSLGENNGKIKTVL